MPPMPARPPLILNFDNSAGAVKGAARLDMQAWQEKIRFACSWRDFEAVSAAISAQLPPAYGTVLLGSGDYHHISYFLIKKLLEKWPQQPANAAAAEQQGARAALPPLQGDTAARPPAARATISRQPPGAAARSSAAFAGGCEAPSTLQGAAGVPGGTAAGRPPRGESKAAPALAAAVRAGRAGAAAFPAAPGERQIQVVILDNHPDNMRYPFGLHCGSWVSHLALLPAVARIDVLGITSADIALAHAWENRLLPLWRGKLRYWSIGVNTGWAAWFGLARAFRNFPDAAAMTAAFIAEQAEGALPVYLSLDKDVLSPACVQTNWDQGVMTKDSLVALLASLQPRLIGADIAGELSAYAYKSLFKRALSALDGQAPVSAAELAAARPVNQDFNRQILPLLV